MAANLKKKKHRKSLQSGFGKGKYVDFLINF